MDGIVWASYCLLQVPRGRWICEYSYVAILDLFGEYYTMYLLWCYGVLNEECVMLWKRVNLDFRRIDSDTRW